MGFETATQIINDASYQARHICGSEGLYQCIIYDLAKRCGQVDRVEREVPVVLPDGKTGYLDFVIDSGGISIAIELKAGANSHRNSLDKAMEVDRRFGTEKSGGLLKDFEKLSAFIKAGAPNSRRAVSVCLETAYIKYGFSPHDVDKYSALANKEAIDFVYGTPGVNPTNLWITSGKRHEITLGRKKSRLEIETSKAFDFGKLDWAAYFADIAMSEPKDETFAQGILYHHLRSLGLTEKQCASEVFFYFARKPGTRASYWLPDLAIFDPGFNGRFNLGINNQEKLQNDYEKLRSLNAIIEIKGSRHFEMLKTSEKVELLRQDLEKLNSHQRPPVEVQTRKEGIRWDRPVNFAMVVASSDGGLNTFIREAKEDTAKQFKFFGLVPTREIGQHTYNKRFERDAETAGFAACFRVPQAKRYV